MKHREIPAVSMPWLLGNLYGASWRLSGQCFRGQVPLAQKLPAPLVSGHPLPCALSQHNGKGHKPPSPGISSWPDLPVAERAEGKNGERKVYVTASALRTEDFRSLHGHQRFERQREPFSRSADEQQTGTMASPP